MVVGSPLTPPRVEPLHVPTPVCTNWSKYPKGQPCQSDKKMMFSEFLTGNMLYSQITLPDIKLTSLSLQDSGLGIVGVDCYSI